MDLRQQFPRSIREKLGGYVHLARMIDKCRATQSNTLGEYIYPCPLDQRLLEFVGVSADKFFHAVGSHSDSEIVEWLQHHGLAHTQTEMTDWNTLMLSRGPDTEEKWAYFKNIRDAIDSTRTDITSWADLLDLEEGRFVPIRTVLTGE